MIDETPPHTSLRYAAPFRFDRLAPDRRRKHFEFCHTRQDPVYVAEGAGLRAMDVVGAFDGLLQLIALVLELGQNSVQYAIGTAATSAQIVSAQGIQAEFHDAFWANNSTVPGHDVLIVASSDPPALFDDLSTYEVSILDAPSTPSGEDLDKLLLADRTWTWGDVPLLSSVTGPAVSFRGYDDEIFRVESRDRLVLQRLLGRLLALDAASTLIDGRDALTVPEPSDEFTAQLLDRFPKMDGVTTVDDQGRAVVCITTAEGTSRIEASDPPSTFAILDLASASWSLSDGAAH